MIGLEMSVARFPLRRLAFAPAALATGVAAIWLSRNQGVGVWPVLALSVMPDIVLLAGFRPGLSKGQLHPRAVLPYNLLHSFAGPALLAAALILHLDPVLLVAALAWATHIAVDRAVGYGMRDKNGFQRG